MVAWGYNYDGETNVPTILTNATERSAAGEHYSLALVGGVPLSPPGGGVSIAVYPFRQTAYSGKTVTLQVWTGRFAPLSYQWQFNGTNIMDATNSFLALADVQVADAGNYAVVVSNVLGTATSRNAVLAVIDSPPVILLGLNNETVYSGKSVIFQIGADGSWPLSYQWQFSGTNILDATNSFLALADVQVGELGELHRRGKQCVGCARQITPC